MKTKKLLIAGLFLATACGVAYCSTESANNVEYGVKLTGVKVDNTESIDFSHFKWLKQYPQLANIESNNQTAMIDKLRTSESISQLIGPINNPYGVRDDILDYIVQKVPADNPKLLQATIQTAYYATLSYFASSDDDKLKYARKESLAMNCMYMFKGDNGRNLANNLVDVFANGLRNNNNRAQYINNLEQTVFAWQTIGSGLGSNTEDEMCKTGEYLK